MFSEIIHRAELEVVQLPVEVSIDHEFGSGERKTELVQLHAIPPALLSGLFIFDLLYPTFCIDPHERRICFCHGRSQQSWTNSIVLVDTCVYLPVNFIVILNSLLILVLFLYYNIEC